MKVTSGNLLAIFSDFAKIVQESKRRPLEGVTVSIERAPECKSIFVSGFSENTTKEQVEEYFDAFSSLEDVVFSPWDEKRKEKRAIVYFKEKKGKSPVFFFSVFFLISTYFSSCGNVHVSPLLLLNNYPFGL